LNSFELKLIWFENRIGRTVLPAPLVSAASTRSLALTPAPCRCPPGPKDARPRLSVTRVRAACVQPPAAVAWQRRRPRVPWPGRCCPTPRRYAVPAAPGPPLSRPRSTPRVAQRPGPPFAHVLPAPPLKGRRAPWAVASGWFSAQYCARGFKCFSIVLNFKNYFKLQKFIETCRNVQKLQNNFCINPLEPVLTVGSTKLTFTQ
jgi:hypothetical protein